MWCWSTEARRGPDAAGMVEGCFAGSWYGMVMVWALWAFHSSGFRKSQNKVNIGVTMGVEWRGSCYLRFHLSDALVRACSRPILRRRCPRMPPLFARCGPCSTVGWAALGTHSQVVPGRTSREINDSRADSMMIELLADSACQKQSKTMVGILFAFFHHEMMGNQL